MNSSSSNASGKLSLHLRDYMLTFVADFGSSAANESKSVQDSIDGKRMGL